MKVTKDTIITIEQACAVHATDADALVAKINEFLESKGE